MDILEGISRQVTPTILQATQGGFITIIPGIGIKATSTQQEAIEFLAEHATKLFKAEPPPVPREEVLPPEPVEEEMPTFMHDRDTPFMPASAPVHSRTIMGSIAPVFLIAAGLFLASASYAGSRFDTPGSSFEKPLDCGHFSGYRVDCRQRFASEQL